ncbi:MAG: DUF1638 domain-containing protein [Candidatus Caldatribacteriaceae bacterium]
MHKIVLKRLKVIACQVFRREISFLLSQVENFCDVEFMSFGLHNTPQKLRESLQEKINQVGKQVFSYSEAGIEYSYDYDGIVLGYGLCSNGTAGLFSSSYPLVIPRAHDCITILLGSKERYKDYLETHRGVYWYSSGWIENSFQPGKERQELIYETYVRKYGPENAEYLMQLENSWQKEYSWATYIKWGFPVDQIYQDFTRECSQFLGWNYESIEGNPALLRDLLSGNWDPERFTIILPGETLQASGDEEIFCPGCLQ